MNEASNSPASKSSSLDVGSSLGSAGSARRRLANSVCAFWLGHRVFAIDTSLLGGVVNVDSLVAVPAAPESVIGLFNLRGTPVALVDLAALLGEPRIPRGPGQQVALVLRPSTTVIAGLLIDRMELVVRLDDASRILRDPYENNPLVQGFLEIEASGGMILTVLEATVLLERLKRLKLR